MLTLSLVCGFCVGGSPDQAAFPAPHSSLLCQSPHLALFPCIFSAGTGPQPHPPGPGNIMLDWAGDMATTQGAEVTGPEASHELAAENSCFLLPGIHFRAALLATLTPAPPPPPHPQGALNLDRSVSAAPSPAQGLQLSPPLSDSSPGLLSCMTLSYFGLIRIMQTSGLGPPVSLAWPSRSGLYLPLRLAWLSPQEEPLLSFSKRTCLQGGTQSSFCIQPSPAIPCPCPSSPPSLCVPASAPGRCSVHGQCCVSALHMGPGASMGLM